ncbi:MAG: hypothetical protein AAGH70_11405 [Pseudomonadota bacterium]
MKYLLMIAAFALPTAALSTPTPLDEVEDAPVAHLIQVAEAPELPFGSPEEAGYCGQAVDPLPDVLTLSLDDEGAALLAFCVIQ